MPSGVSTRNAALIFSVQLWPSLCAGRVFILLMTAPAPLQLIVGLGNPGAQYSQTRHNVGFRWVDALADHLHIPWKLVKDLQAQLAITTVPGRRLVLVKPATFMNLSGNAVTAVLNYYRISTAAMLVAHDELDLAPGTLKLKFSGGHAGHNGLRSIHDHQGADYWRLRLGIGHPGHKSQVSQWVLNRPGKLDLLAIEGAIAKAVAHCDILLAGDIEAAKRAMHTIVPASP